MAKFKPRDRVIFVDNRDNYTEGDNNPLWGGKYGNVKGTIDAINHTKKYLLIKVIWDNGHCNHYHPHNLKHVSIWRLSMIPDVFKSTVDYFGSAGKELLKTIEPYKKYFFLGALLLVMDYFLFKGTYTNKLKDMTQKLANKILETLNNFIETVVSPSEDSSPESEPETAKGGK